MTAIKRLWEEYRKSSRRDIGNARTVTAVNEAASELGRCTAETARRTMLMLRPDDGGPGYNADEAPVVGLLTKAAGLLATVCEQATSEYEEDRTVLCRPIVATTMLARHLMSAGRDELKDFRERKWPIQGRELREIFKKLDAVNEFTTGYGMASESIHGSWAGSLDYDLTRHSDDYFLADTSRTPTDTRTVVPMVRYVMLALTEWIKRKQLHDEVGQGIVETIREEADRACKDFERLYRTRVAAEDSENGTRERSGLTREHEVMRSSSPQELEKLVEKYKEPRVRALLTTQSAKENRWQIFFRDMVEVLDIVCRMRDTERNPTGFSEDEAPILGLLVRTCKLLRTTTWAFDNGKAQCALISERAAIEASVMAQYLMRSGPEAVADYRRCAFRDRLEILRRAEEGDSVVCGTPAGQRIVRSIKEKLSNERLTSASFGTQERHRWRVGGHPFRHIFKTVINDSMYDAAYRMGSDAVHGSWSDLCMFWLVRSDRNRFYPQGNERGSDVTEATISSLVALAAFNEWSARVGLENSYAGWLLQVMERIGVYVFERHYNEHYMKRGGRARSSLD